MKNWKRRGLAKEKESGVSAREFFSLLAGAKHFIVLWALLIILNGAFQAGIVLLVKPATDDVLLVQTNAPVVRGIESMAERLDDPDFQPGEHAGEIENFLREVRGATGKLNDEEGRTSDYLNRLAIVEEGLTGTGGVDRGEVREALGAMADFLDAAEDRDEFLQQVLKLVILTIALMLGQGLAHAGEGVVTAVVTNTVIRDLRSRVFEHIQRLDLAFFEGQKAGDIMSRVLNDIGIMRDFFTTALVNLFKAPVFIAFAVIAAIVLSWKIMLVACIAVPLVLLVVKGASGKVRGLTHDVQREMSDITSVLEEGIGGVLEIRSFTNQPYEVKRFERANRDNYLAEVRRAKVKALVIPLYSLIIGAGLAGVFWQGSSWVSRGELTLGTLLAIIFLIAQIQDKGNRFTKTYLRYQENLAVYARIRDFLAIRPSIFSPEKPTDPGEIKGRISFENVLFSYGRDGDDAVLKDINLQVEPGRLIALVGPSGAGKSSLVKLIPRFYDVAEGSVRVDGVDVREFDLTKLRSHIGIVPQNPVLFGTTVAENIRYGRLDASDEEVEQAARAANAHEFITRFPRGYSTMVGERGATLSGGQAQRVSIARAILKDPKILILDEATSSLDTASEELVQQALEKLMVGRTTLVIAHRLSTVLGADEILVLADGRIIERGRHLDLMGERGVYADLYRRQFGEKG
jgi:subfamily B ATP-binding cassette protein MsbA